MLLPLPKRDRRMEDNVLPLINVVFLLLIFFMVAGSMQVRAPFRVQPPDTANAADATARPGVLVVGADGQLALGGKMVDKAELRKRLAERDGGEPLQIKADADMKASRLSDLLALARGAGIAKVQLITVRSEP